MPDTEAQDEILENPEPTIDDAPIGEDKKEHDKAFFKLRKAEERAQQLQRELDAIKTREKESRNAQLSETEKLREELTEIKSQWEKDRTDALKQRVANEFALPSNLADRLIGSDYDSLAADAADLAKLIKAPKVGTTTNPVRSTAPDIDAQIRDAEKAGNAALSIQLKRQKGGFH